MVSWRFFTRGFVSMESPLFLAAEAFDLPRVARLVRAGARDDDAFLADLIGRFDPNDPLALEILERLSRGGLPVRDEKDALFDLYATLLEAGHPAPDGSGRRCVARVVFGAREDRWARAERLGAMLLAAGALDWRTSAWAAEQDQDRDPGNWMALARPAFQELPTDLVTDALAAAAKAGHAAMVDRLLAALPRDADAFQAAARQSTNPFYAAVAAGQVAATERLLAHFPEATWARMGHSSALPTTAFRTAAMNGQPRMLAWLVDQGLHRTDPCPARAVSGAIQYKHFGIVPDLLSLGLDLNHFPPLSNSTLPPPLHMAVWMQQRDLVDALLAAGCSPALTDAGGGTALHTAARVIGMHSAVQALLAAGAPLEAVDREGNTPLMTAARAGRMDAFVALQEAGASLAVHTPEGEDLETIATGPVKASLAERRLERTMAPGPTGRGAPRL